MRSQNIKIPKTLKSESQTPFPKSSLKYDLLAILIFACMFHVHVKIISSKGACVTNRRNLKSGHEIVLVYFGGLTFHDTQIIQRNVPVPIAWYSEKEGYGNVLEESGVKAERSDADATVLDVNTEDVKYESVSSDNSACKYEMSTVSVKQEIVSGSVVSAHYDPVMDVFDELTKLKPTSPGVNVPLNADANQDSVDTHHQDLTPASPSVSVPQDDDDANPDLGDTDHQESPPASPSVSVPQDDDDANPDLGDTDHQESPPASPSVSIPQDNDDANQDTDYDSPSATLGSNDSVVSDNNDAHPDKVDIYSIKHCKVVLEQLDMELLEKNVMRTANTSVQVKKYSVVLNRLHPGDVKKYTDKSTNVLPSVSKSDTITRKPMKTKSYIKQKQAIVLKYLYKCSKCVKKFSTQNRLYKHERTHSVGHYVCTACNRCFQYPKTLRDHKVTHTPRLFIKCTVRGYAKKYASVESLKYHLTTHDGYRHKCNYCNFKLTTKQNLVQHLRGSHGQGVLKARCSKKFSWPSLCQKH